MKQRAREVWLSALNKYNRQGSSSNIDNLYKLLFDVQDGDVVSFNRERAVNFVLDNYFSGKKRDWGRKYYTYDISPKEIACEYCDSSVEQVNDCLIHMRERMKLGHMGYLLRAGIVQKLQTVEWFKQRAKLNEEELEAWLYDKALIYLRLEDYNLLYALDSAIYYGEHGFGSADIDILDISIKVYNALNRAGVSKLGDVVSLGKGGLLNVRDIGIKSCREISGALLHLNIFLK